MSSQFSKPVSPFVLIFVISLLVISTLVVISRFFLAPVIEHQIQERIETTIQGNANGELLINISGRDVNLKGIVENETDKFNVENIISGVVGVRQLNSELLIKNQTTE